MRYLLLFLEGVITFVSPCLLPMLPIYLSYFAAGQAGKRGALKGSAGFVAGFSSAFAVMGAFAGTVGGLLIRHAAVVNAVTGFIVVMFGLNFMGVIRLGLLNRTFRVNKTVKVRGFFSSALFGVVFAVSWTPCVGAFLGSALMLAAQRGSAAQGALMLLTFSMGLGVPFVISAALLDSAKGAFDFIKRHYGTVNIICGVFLVVMGILMATGHMGKFLSLLSA